MVFLISCVTINLPEQVVEPSPCLLEEPEVLAKGWHTSRVVTPSCFAADVLFEVCCKICQKEDVSRSSESQSRTPCPLAGHRPVRWRQLSLRRISKTADPWEGIFLEKRLPISSHTKLLPKSNWGRITVPEMGCCYRHRIPRVGTALLGVRGMAAGLTLQPDAEV